MIVTGCSHESPRAGADGDGEPSRSADRTATSIIRELGAELTSLESLVPGAVIEVRSGLDSDTVAFGQADVEKKSAMTAEHRFQIGSITKTMVAVLVLQLIADGRLSLSDTAEELLPGLLPRGERTTVEHLLSHRSGLYNFTEATGLDFARHWQPTDIVAVATDRPLLFPPGAHSSYSNTNYIVLGLILEEVTGQSVEELLQTEIFDRAEMSSTSLDPRRVTEPPIAHGYEAGADVTATDLSLAWAAGGVVSTAADLTRFMDALFHDRLGDGVLKEMSTWRGVLARGGFEYGLGLGRIPVSCGEAWGHNGGTAGFASEAWSLPDGSRSVIILVNEVGYEGVTAGRIDSALCM